MDLFLLAIFVLAGGLIVGGGATEAGASSRAAWLFCGAYEIAIWSVIYIVARVGGKIRLE